MSAVGEVDGVRRVNGVGVVVVVVPAHDEEQLLGACLSSVLVSAARARSAHRGLHCHVVVVLDRCRDGTASCARAFPTLIVTSRGTGVGAARREGALTALRLARFDGCPPERTWLVSTDADTVVPAHWLSAQLELAQAGADVVIGTVEPDEVGGSGVVEHWHERHQLGDGHPHVHGANIGVRGSAYLSAGGFGDEALHEDVNLVRRLLAGPHRCVATDQVRVRTSARATGRVTGGFADYVAALPSEPAPSPGVGVSG